MPHSELRRPEIECVEVMKVFDNCLKFVEYNETDPLPATCTLPATFSISCALSNVACDGPLTQEPHTTDDNMANVWFRITWDKTITITDSATGVVACTINTAHSLTEIVSLFAPPGFDMTYQCRVLSSTCNACTHTVIDGVPSILCEVEFCLDIESKYPVKLKVWTSGECHPGPCDPKQVPKSLQLMCPPRHIYPPQRPRRHRPDHRHEKDGDMVADQQPE